VHWPSGVIRVVARYPAQLPIACYDAGTGLVGMQAPVAPCFALWRILRGRASCSVLHRFAEPKRHLTHVTQQMTQGTNDVCVVTFAGLSEFCKSGPFVAVRTLSKSLCPSCRVSRREGEPLHLCRLKATSM
jgi:hypothetical protein